MYQFKVEGLHCGSCVSGIIDWILRVDSEATIKEDLDSEVLEVDSKASREALKKAIEDAGYKVTN